MVSARLAITWDAPEGFHVFRSGGEDEQWVREIVAPLALAEDHEVRLTRQLEDFVILSRLDPDDIVHIAGTATGRWGHPELCCSGRIEVGPIVDLDEVAESWVADVAAPISGQPVIVKSPGRRAPAVSARLVYLHRGRDGVERYREQGVALVNVRAHDCSVRAEITTWDLSAFDDIGAFALESARGVILEAPHVDA